MGSPFALKRGRSRIHEMSRAIQSTLSSNSSSPTSPSNPQNSDLTIPSAASLLDKCTKFGELKKLVGRGILTLGQGVWKSRFCILVKNKLYFYENEDCKGTEKSSGFINLSYYDTCNEASTTRMAKKASNVFVIGTEKGFFETHSGRHYFACETLDDMKDWMGVIHGAMKNSTKSTKDQKTKQRSQSSKPSMAKLSGEENGVKKSSKDSSPAAPDTLRLSGRQLDNMTKNRVKGPPGRRLPARKTIYQSRPSSAGGSNSNSKSKSQVESQPMGKNDEITKGSFEDHILDENGPNSLDDNVILRDSKGRATSLSALEILDHHNFNQHHHHHHRETHIPYYSKHSNSRPDWGSRSFDFVEREKSISHSEMTYRYSSSDDDEDHNILISQNHQNDIICPPSPRLIQSTSGTPIFNQRRNNQNRVNTISGFKGTIMRPSATLSTPPCITRKFRRELSKSFQIDDSSQHIQLLSEVDYNLRAARRTSSGSSLSTLTAGDTSSLSTTDRNLSYSSLKRDTDLKKKLGSGQRQQTTHGHSHGTPLTRNIERSPYMSNRHNHNVKNTLTLTSNGHNQLSGGSGAIKSNGHLERNVSNLKIDLGTCVIETKQLDADVNSLRQDVGILQENIATVRGLLDMTKDRVNRVSCTIGHIERQIGSALKESQVIRDEAKSLLQQAETTKGTHEQLQEEVENLLGFLRQMAISTTHCTCNCSSSTSMNNQNQKPQHVNNFNSLCSADQQLVQKVSQGQGQVLVKNPAGGVDKRLKRKTPDRTPETWEKSMPLLDTDVYSEPLEHGLEKDNNYSKKTLIYETDQLYSKCHQQQQPLKVIDIDTSIKKNI